MTDGADAQQGSSFHDIQDASPWLPPARGEISKDSFQLIQELSDEIVESILEALSGSILTKYIANGAYRKLASRFEGEGFDNEGQEIGIVLQEMALNIYAIIKRGSSARHADQFNHLENPTRTAVEQLVEQCVVKIRNAVFGFVMGSQIENSVGHFADRLYHERVQLTEPLVASVLQEVWFKLAPHMQR